MVGLHWWGLLCGGHRPNGLQASTDEVWCAGDIVLMSFSRYLNWFCCIQALTWYVPDIKIVLNFFQVLPYPGSDLDVPVSYDGSKLKVRLFNPDQSHAQSPQLHVAVGHLTFLSFKQRYLQIGTNSYIQCTSLQLPVHSFFNLLDSSRSETVAFSIFPLPLLSGNLSIEYVSLLPGSACRVSQASSWGILFTWLNMIALPSIWLRFIDLVRLGMLCHLQTFMIHFCSPSYFAVY